MAPLKKKKKGGGYLVVVCLVRPGVVGSSVQRLCRHPRLLLCCLSLQRSGSSNVWAKRINLTPCSASFKHNNLMVAFLNFSGFHLSCYYELFFFSNISSKLSFNGLTRVLAGNIQSSCLVIAIFACTIDNSVGQSDKLLGKKIDYMGVQLGRIGLRRECEWLFVSVCGPVINWWLGNGVTPPSPEDSWDWLSLFVLSPSKFNILSMLVDLAKSNGTWINFLTSLVENC